MHLEDPETVTEAVASRVSDSMTKTDGTVTTVTPPFYPGDTHH